MTLKKNVVLGITGSIAAYKACDVISALRREGCAVTCVMTRESQEFISKLSLQTLSCSEVYTEMFAAPSRWNPAHTSLADWANLVLIAPATASVIGKLASGICDDLLTCIALATKAPLLIAPAMNDKMYSHKIVSENIEKLKGIGYKFVGPVKGRLACGYAGMGHIAPVEDIVKEAKRLLK